LPEAFQESRQVNLSSSVYGKPQNASTSGFKELLALAISLFAGSNPGCPLRILEQLGIRRKTQAAIGDNRLRIAATDKTNGQARVIR
jgi:hypothetical protein